MKKKEVKKIVFWAVGFVLVSILAFLTFEQVDAGKVKVVTEWGRVTDRTLYPGFHVLVPFANSTIAYNTKKVIYETTTEDKQKGSQADYKDYPVDTNTSDGQQVDVFFTVRFSVDPDKAGWVAQNIGNMDALVENVVKTESRIWARTVPREFSAEELYTGDGVVRVQNKIFDRLVDKFADNGIVLDTVGIREIKFTDQYVGAIEAKQIEAVRVETEENRANQAEFRKQATIKDAEAEAEKQRLQSQTITNQFLQKEWISKWDGKLPTYMLGGEGVILQLPQ